ncbi:PREDICTED: E3 ubiquitin-protein ligase msl-2 [Drosophila arizonae]|uniref:E3 ubiquitin-protein ligase msl-2 n=1 Tax=Drosophila arizonae TaxID=7263 RepID=A0ABM1NSY0_DROAR|nr:PREDICTED: E3 ubiquitin-protein ligase msl-2 [Drosophila arizonae]XP_017858066.1 PREDICTED: E3 ubiquitin-protein ligase msl-2 [Drosophila arizonae]
MEAQRLYIQITLLSLKSASNLSTRRIHEINTGIGELRQLLSCAVCCKLLNDPYKPKGRRCGHHVCRLCMRGRKNLWPSCPQCKDCSDFRTYEENKTMALQLLCYKTLCVHLRQSALYSEFFHLRPDIKSSINVERKPRIRLPNRSTQWFIEEGANYENMSETFLLQPDLPFLANAPSSLPAETPPTTAATTPELPYEQHMPNQLSITDIELEAAATGEQAQYAHPLPMMTSGARMLTHTHIAPQPQQVLVPADEPMLPAGYIESPWSDQVDLSGAFTIPADYVNSTSNYTTYVMPNGEVHMAPIGQVVQLSHQEQLSEQDQLSQQEQLSQEEQLAEVATVEPMETVEPDEPIVASTSKATAFKSVNVSGSIKRRRAQMLLDHVEDEDMLPSTKAVAPTSTLTNFRNKKPTIISSVQVKPPTATGSPIRTLAAAPIATDPATAPVPVAAVPMAAVPTQVSAVPASLAPVPVAAVPISAVPPSMAIVPAPIATTPASIAAVPAPIAAIPAPIAAVPAPITAAPASKVIVPSAPKPVATTVVKAAPKPAPMTATKPVAKAAPKPPAKPVAKSAPKPAAATHIATAAKAALPVAASVVAKTPAATAKMATMPHTSTPKAIVHKPKPKDARMSHICRCGTTSAPGKATCRNSRCTCYVAGKSCVDCKCIGCKNPHQDATDTSDEEDFNMDIETEVAPAEEPAEEPVEEPTPASTDMQSGFTLVPLDNLQQSQHPLVLMQNENGQYQGFNIFNGSEPVDPATLGFQRVPLRSNDGNSSIPEFAYIMPPPTVEPTTATTEPDPPPSPTMERPAKRFKSFRKRLDMERNVLRKSADMLVSAGNAAAGDGSMDGDKDEAILERIFSDFSYFQCTIVSYTFYACFIHVD